MSEQDLDKMYGHEVIVEVRGHKITVHEITMRNIKAFAKICGPFMSSFDEAAELSSRQPSQADSDFKLFNVLLEYSDDFMKAAAMVSNADVTFYEKLRPDEFFAVASAVVEVNGNFFVHALAPALIKFAKGISTIGLILSPPSSPQDTVTQTF